MKIAIAQLNVIVGDLAGNAEKIMAAAQRARADGASLLVTTELALCGYPPEDLLLRDSFFRACDEEFQRLVSAVSGITLVLGHPHQIGIKRYNAASVIRDGKVVATYLKRTLPNYTVFDEERYFDSGEEPCVFEQDGIRIGINICADVWEEPAAKAAREAGAQLLLVLNASPYHINKQLTRYEVVRERVRKTGMSVIYANQVGGQDELVFDGASFAVDGRGELMHQFPAFREVVVLVEVVDGVPVKGEVAPVVTEEEDVYNALTLGVRDYLGKNGFPGALLGLSGGIDSALTLALAVDALGADKVHAVMMPSQYTAGMSCEDARAQAQTMGVRYSEIAIRPVFDAFKAALARNSGIARGHDRRKSAGAHSRHVADGNVEQVRGNRADDGNKSEMGTGYATLYGDMAGGFAVLKDIRKTLVYRLAHYRNTRGDGDSRTGHYTAAVRGAASLTRPTRTVCRLMRCWTPSWRPMSSRTSARRRSSRADSRRPTSRGWCG